MTSTEVPVSMWCWPGPRAAAGVQAGPAGEHLLAVFLDPMNIVLTVPPFPTGPAGMARFLRELARAAFSMAAELDPPARAGGAHRAVDGEAGRGRNRGEPREPVSVVTLRAAREQINREWPGRHAPVAAWRAYYQRAARLYAQVAEVDTGHHHEALYWAGQARESLRALAAGAEADRGAQ